MRRLLCLIVLSSVICTVYAQDFTITFQPKVSGTSIDSVQVINLRTNQVVKLSGGETLLLVKPTSIDPLHDNLEKEPIYPNPTDEGAAFCFSTSKTQDVEIRLYNANGQILNQKRQNLVQGTHRFELKFPIAGIYFVSLLKSNESTSFKAVYTGKTLQSSSILYAGSEILNSHKSDLIQLKVATTDKTLIYSEGDFIQYSVSSGVNTTIITETPTVSKAFYVEFVNCIDKDNKSYKAVKIGTHWWMAENLAYLPTVYPSSNGSYTDPRYYVYGYQGTDVAAAKNSPNYASYGVLYNWPAAMVASPPGWHLPNYLEWNALTTFIGGESVAGGKLKESEYTHWNSPNTGATNKIGFTALPAGYRIYYGSFGYIDYLGIWWSSNIYITNYAWSRSMSYYFSDVFREYYYMEYGFSVRCIRD
jgi:uncharacterized protein (TIGR02145 family)